MKVVFVSNYYNHHQSAISEELYRLTGGRYAFVATEPMEEERLRMGWGGESASFVKSYHDDPVACQALLNRAEVVIWGAAPYALIKPRLKKKKLTFAYMERLYKIKDKWYKYPKRLWDFYSRFNRYKHFHLLCASGYTAADFARTGSFKNRAYKWGYFPAVNEYDVDGLMEGKEKNSLLWVARLLALKHPEAVIATAKRLKEEGYSFTLRMIGDGEILEQTQAWIREANVEDCVQLLGAMKPNEVRAYMEKSEIFFFTSDRNEGWGAVMNESMNSGCAVVASHIVGSAPFLVKNGENGLLYKDGDLDSLYTSAKALLEDREGREKLGRKAYDTIVKEWNAKVAAERFLALSEKLLAGEEVEDSFASGPCSKAEIIKDNWLK